MVAEGRVLKLGKTLGVVDVTLRADGRDDVVAKAQVTYSIPPPSATVRRRPTTVVSDACARRRSGRNSAAAGPASGYRRTRGWGSPLPLAPGDVPCRGHDRRPAPTTRRTSESHRLAPVATLPVRETGREGPVARVSVGDDRSWSPKVRPAAVGTTRDDLWMSCEPAEAVRGRRRRDQVGSAGPCRRWAGPSGWVVVTGARERRQRRARRTGVVMTVVLVLSTGVVTGAALSGRIDAVGSAGLPPVPGRRRWRRRAFPPWRQCPPGAFPAQLAAQPGRLGLLPLFRQWASICAVPVALVEATCWWESGWQEDEVSVTGAVGVCQIEPAAAQTVRRLVGDATLDRRSASDNIEMSAAYLRWLLDETGGRQDLALAGYYQGLTSVREHGILPGEPSLRDGDHRLLHELQLVLRWRGRDAEFVVVGAGVLGLERGAVARPPPAPGRRVRTGHRGPRARRGRRGRPGSSGSGTTIPDTSGWPWWRSACGAISRSSRGRTLSPPPAR